MSTEPDLQGDSPAGPRSGIPDWLRQTGLACWLLLGIAGALALLGFIFAVTRGVTIPLIVAVVVGAVFVPLVDGLEKLRIPRWLGSIAVTLALLLVAVGTLALVIWGIFNDAEDIGRQVQAGVTQVGDWLAAVGLDEELSSRVRDQLASSGGFAGGGVLSFIVGGLTSAASFLVGAFIAINILFFMMKDAHTISAWMRARVSGIVATTLLGDAARSLRAYFRGRTIVGAASAVTVYVGALLLGVPLAASIALVTFFTSFIPYIGAFIAGAFAVLLALGEGGLSSALGILAVVVFANVVVENLVTPFAVGATLRLHPLVVLVVTIVGGIVAGFVGITLAAPATAIGVQVVGRLRAAGVFDRGPEAPPEPAPRTDQRRAVHTSEVTP